MEEEEEEEEGEGKGGGGGWQVRLKRQADTKFLYHFTISITPFPIQLLAVTLGH